MAPLLALTRHEGQDLGHCGFTPLQTAPPDWWRLRHEVTAPSLTVQETPPPPQADQNGQLTFLGAAPPEPTSPFGWIEELLGSPIYQAQREQAAVAPEDGEVRIILETLALNEGRVHLSAIARALKLSEHRVGRRLSSLRGLLNLDGYTILSVHRSEETVRLDQTMLRRQFHLAEGE
jgi:hypothetical protein